MTERILTDRLEIAPIDEKLTEEISARNTGDGIDKYLESLSKEEIVEVFSDMDAIKAVMARMTATKSAPRSYSYGAWLDTELVGFTTLLECGDGVWEVQVELAPEYQHKGYGYEFLSHLIPEMFAADDIKCLRYTVVPSNKASIALVEKLGAELQEPKTQAEKILLKTYMIRSNGQHGSEKI